LTKGDSLGGKMRNIVGALAQRKLCMAIICSLRLSNIDFYVLNDTSYKMAGEIFNNLKSKYINNAANLTKPEHITALSDWLINL
jgi:hypothetical protein